MACDAAKSETRRAEPFRQIPLSDEYWARLEGRAADNDRIASREAAWILKRVLDGHYVMSEVSAANGRV